MSRQLAVILVGVVLGREALALQGVSVPPALLNMDQARRKLETGQLDCAWEWRKTTSLGLEVVVFNYATARFAGDERILVLRGDDEGVVSRNVEGRPADRRPVSMLLKDGQQWRHVDGSWDAEWHLGVRFDPPFDPRLLGALSALPCRDRYDSPWYEDETANCRFTERVEGELVVVTQVCEGWKCEWWIDPQRGWNAVRVRAEFARGGWGESRSSLKQFDGLWFPERVEFFSSDWKDGQEPVERVWVYRAEFNRPEHPRTFRPDDIGITRGTQVNVRDENLRPFNEPGVYDGREVVPMSRYMNMTTEEFRALLERAGITSPRLLADALASRPAGEWASPEQRAALIDPNDLPGRLKRVQDVESEWEAYTRRFIEKYRLDGEQSEKAWQILKTCQGHAHGYLTRRRAEFERLEKEVAGLAGLSGTERLARAAAINELAGKLARPLEEIFERQLKPRLETLPTRKQRAAAEGSPATQPGRP